MRLHRRRSVENETPQEGRGTSHSEEAHAERAASANAFVKIQFNLYSSREEFEIENLHFLTFRLLVSNKKTTEMLS